jgi:response regulator RpfG family c-di-GMP phosphodiesterase
MDAKQAETSMEPALKHYRILLVDDEPEVLNALRRELSSPPLGHNHYAIETFTSAEEALECARSQPFDLAISDFLMPGMDGLEFLREFAQIRPDAVRILISGRADNETIRAAINDTHIYRCISKPWHDYYLKGSVSQALAWRDEVLENRRLADEMRKLGLPQPPAPPADYHAIMVVDDEEGITSALYRELTHHSNFDDLFDAMRLEKTGEHSSKILRHKFFVDTFNVPQKALDAAGRTKYDCIIADYRMPGMDGVELLQSIRKIQPDCALIMISAYTDSQILLGAINDAHVYSFFYKPWNAFELKSSIIQAIAQRDLLLENSRLAEALKKHRSANP